MGARASSSTSLAFALSCFFYFLTLSAAQTSYIAHSCRTTRYPIVCVRSLRGYSSAIQKNHRLLASTALAVSLEKARLAEGFMTKLTKFPGLRPRERAAAADCLDLVGDSVDRLSRSVQELKISGRAKGPELLWRLSNVQTWVSAALTDYTTCMDGFSGRVLNGRVKNSVRARMLTSVQVTSNALALCNNQPHY